MSEAQTGEAPRRKRLVAVGVFAFVIAAIAIVPASLITPLLNANAANIQYQEVRGTIWNGEIRHVSTGDIYLGNLSFKLRPLALLTGGASADITVQDGAAIGAGRISVNLISQRLSLSNVNAAFNLSAVRRYSLFGIPYQGRVEMRQTNLSLSRSGCHSASGEVWTDVLDSSSQTLVGESLLLAGPAACDDGRIMLTLRGGNREGDAEIMIAIDPAMTYRVLASVELGRADFENNLRRLGFEDGDGVLIYDAIGALKGTGS